MILEIAGFHFVSIIQIIYFGCRRCCDRGCTCDEHKSRQLLQSEYEDLYIGPDFGLDGRLAQMIAIVWVVFMYSSALPALFPLTVLNFLIIYWIDKFLLLRFFRTPKNYDQESIFYTISEMRTAILFHFIVGLFVYSNQKILTNSGMKELNALLDTSAAASAV